MSFLVDANVIVYAVSPGPRRDPSLALLEAVAEDRAPGACSTAIIEEVWHLELGGGIEGLGGQTRRAWELFRPLLAVDDQIVRQAFDLELGPDAEIGANDRIHAATCLHYGFGAIVSADRGFDAVPALLRIDPLDGDGMATLLRG